MQLKSAFINIKLRLREKLRRFKVIVFLHRKLIRLKGVFISSGQSGYEKPTSIFTNSETTVVEVYLQGGLGNQLFQFAHGLAVAQHFNKLLYLSSDSYSIDKKRKFALGFLDVLPDKYYEVELVGDTLELKIAENIDQVSEVIEVREVSYHYTQINPNLLLKKNIKLVGYWQSQKYFYLLEEPIRKFITGHISGCARQIDLAIHVRRGDFLQPEIHQYHGLLSETYYEKALSLVPASEFRRNICVLSDSENLDQESLFQANKKGDNWIFDSGLNEVDALGIMIDSKSLIIGNSSFSWWGGFLGSQGRLVICPRYFFSESTLRLNNICDLYPDGWVLV